MLGIVYLYIFRCLIFFFYVLNSLSLLPDIIILFPDICNPQYRVYFSSESFQSAPMLFIYFQLPGWNFFLMDLGLWVLKLEKSVPPPLALRVPWAVFYHVGSLGPKPLEERGGIIHACISPYLPCCRCSLSSSQICCLLFNSTKVPSCWYFM